MVGLCGVCGLCDQCLWIGISVFGLVMFDMLLLLNVRMLWNVVLKYSLQFLCLMQLMCGVQIMFFICSRLQFCRIGLFLNMLIVIILGWLCDSVLMSVFFLSSLVWFVLMSSDVGFICIRFFCFMMLCVLLCRCRCSDSMLFCLNSVLWLVVVVQLLVCVVLSECLWFYISMFILNVLL